MPEFGIEELEVRPTPTSSNEPRAVKSRENIWTFLPSELWLIILVDYGLTSKDLVKLDRCCKWFSNPWQGKIICNSRPILGMRRHHVCAQACTSFAVYVYVYI